MMMSMMAPVHEEMHQRAGKDEKQRRDCRQMRAVPEDEIGSGRSDEGQQEKPLRIGKAAKHLSPSRRGKARSGAGELDIGQGLLRPFAQ